MRQMILSAAREGSYCDLLLASDGEEGLALAVQHKPQLILLDWIMPGMSGLDVLKEIRARSSIRRTPVFMLTSRGKMGDVEDALAMGADGYFTKPIKPSQLFSRLCAQIQGA